MMHCIHAVFSLELMALVSGVALLIFIKNQDKITKAWPIFIAWFVIIFSSLSIICSASQAIIIRYQGGCPMYRFMMMERNKDMPETNKDDDCMYRNRREK
jgi:hypothetical protein